MFEINLKDKSAKRMCLKVVFQMEWVGCWKKAQKNLIAKIWEKKCSLHFGDHVNIGSLWYKVYTLSVEMDSCGPILWDPILQVGSFIEIV